MLLTVIFAKVVYEEAKISVCGETLLSGLLPVLNLGHGLKFMILNTLSDGQQKPGGLVHF